MAKSSILQFAPFSSAVDVGFWYQLSQKKLDVYKLEDKPVTIFGFYTNCQQHGMPPVANIDYSSFNYDIQAPPRSFALKGTLMNTNTLEDFKAKDKAHLIQLIGKQIWSVIKDGTAIDDPSLLQQFLCLTFADLKKYRYYYWLAFPAFIYPEVQLYKPPEKLQSYFSIDQVTQLFSSYNTLPLSDKTAFLIYVSETDSVSTCVLSCYDSLKFKSGKILLGFSDPSSLELYPGWPLRNLLALVAFKWGNERKIWNIVCLRETVKDNSRVCNNSLLISVEIVSENIPSECPKTIGWEKYKNKLIPQIVDMSSGMDPLKLADSAVDLNLKLMRWRLLPELDLDSIKSVKCLLLGAGTLGCNVARCLLGWGVRNITFVDNSTVSYSNPVRQTLFCFDDCLQGGKPKAKAAAEALNKVFPGVNSEGVFLNIPMPGHALSEKIIEETRNDIEKLEELIFKHDVIFLLMDTRESRWLPTVISYAKQKTVINAALGFDSFLVMRHGFRETDSVLPNAPLQGAMQTISGSELGCYFCNDVVAPGNSVRDRTLDQQCTVTRPGVSYIASALAVELMVSILQHSKRAGVAAVMTTDDDTNSTKDCITPLGIIPHQIRGYLDHFQNTIHASKAFDRCIACSSQVLKEYNTHGFKFLMHVFNEPNYLEDLTGLTELLQNVSADDVFELSDDSSI